MVETEQQNHRPTGRGRCRLDLVGYCRLFGGVSGEEIRGLRCNEAFPEEETEYPWWLQVELDMKKRIVSTVGAYS
jgi:hypothetical protein